MKANNNHALAGHKAPDQRIISDSNPLNQLGEGDDMGLLPRRTDETDRNGAYCETFGSRKLLSSSISAVVSPQSVSRCIAIVLKELIMQGEEEANHCTMAAPYRIFDKPKHQHPVNILRQSMHNLHISLTKSAVHPNASIEVSLLYMCMVTLRYSRPFIVCM